MDWIGPGMVAAIANVDDERMAVKEDSIVGHCKAQSVVLVDSM